jgi:hypothetical protein
MTTASHAPRPPRYPIRLGAELDVEGRVVTGTTRNLSTGGVCIELDRPLHEGALYAIRLFLVEDDIESAAGRQLELSATAQWVAEAERGYAVGFRFSSLTAAQIAALDYALKTVGEQ